MGRRWLGVSKSKYMRMPHAESWPESLWWYVHYPADRPEVIDTYLERYATGRAVSEGFRDELLTWLSELAHVQTLKKWGKPRTKRYWTIPDYARYMGMEPHTLMKRLRELENVAKMLFPERGTGGELRLLAFRGFNPQAARFWEWVRADSKSTCGMALRASQRVVAPDIVDCDFMADSEDQQVYLQTGIRACQTTPLIARAGNVVGMISTHWRRPHQPSEKHLRLFDSLARQAADLIDSLKATSRAAGCRTSRC